MARKAVVAIVVGVVAVLAFALLMSAMTRTEDGEETPSRADLIPTDAVKGTPSTDLFPPILHSDDWLTPVPMPGPVNTAGAEDSPFITPDGDWFFFFFTPNVSVPVQEQLLDGVTGIWWTQRHGSTWTEPERIVLHNDVALDGAPFVQGDELWFASVRAGNYGEIDLYTARYVDGKWIGVKSAGPELNSVLDVGEFHLTADGLAMYYGGPGETSQDTDIWIAHKVGDVWGKSSRVRNVNSDLNENQPFLTQEGDELWFTGQSRLGHTGPAVFRSVWNGSEWGPPEEIVSNFAGEPTLDLEGNLYFVHHFFDSEMSMIEADVYVAYRNASLASALSSVDPGDEGLGLDRNLANDERGVVCAADERFMCNDASRGVCASQLGSAPGVRGNEYAVGRCGPEDGGEEAQGLLDMRSRQPVWEYAVLDARCAVHTTYTSSIPDHPAT